MLVCQVANIAQKSITLGARQAVAVITPAELLTREHQQQNTLTHNVSTLNNVEQNITHAEKLKCLQEKSFNTTVTFRSDRDRPLVTPQRSRIPAVIRVCGAVGTGVIFRDGPVRGPTDRGRLRLTVGRCFDDFDRRVDRAYCGRGYFHFTGIGAS